METIELDNEDDVLELLIASNERWYLGEPGMWLFRGQRDNKWPLLPAAHRPEVLAQYLKRKVDIPVTPEDRLPPLEEHIGAEFAALLEFNNLCDDVGVAIPGDSSELRLYRQRYRAFVRATRDLTWPEDSMLPALALAQHHGVPTRLLDFSRNPRTALFFALLDQLRDVDCADPDSKMVVWAVDYAELADHYIVGREHTREPRFELVSAPKDSN